MAQASANCVSNKLLIVISMFMNDLLLNRTTEQVHDPYCNNTAIKTMTAHHCAAHVTYTTAHNKQSLLSHIFMPSIDFYKYHKNKKLMMLFAVLPTHAYPHNILKSNVHRYVISTNINLQPYCSETELRNH
jgi:hypothetical protein